MLYGFLNAVGATLVVGTRHDGTSTKRFDTQEDALVIGSDVGLGKYGDGLFVNTLNDGLSTQHGQGLAWETRGGIAGGDDSNKLHSLFLKFSAKI